MAFTNFQLLIAVIMCSLHDVYSECGGSKADIVFILDSSGSVKESNFQKTKEFFKTMVGGFQIGPNNVRMASVTFSTKIHDTFQFSKYNSVESLRNGVSRIPYDSGGTNTHLALKYARETSFSYARSGVSKIAVVITDGKSNNKQKTLEEAQKLSDSDVIIFSVGVGSGVDRSELEGMASKSTYVFDVATFSALESIRQRLTKTACEVISCGDPGVPTNGDRSGDDFSKGKSVNYTCDEDFQLKGSSIRTCLDNSTWSGSLPKCIFVNPCWSSPCLNKATCINGENYTCQCENGYGGVHCENDIQPPVVHYCPPDILEFSRLRFVNVTWTGPNISDPHDHDVDVTTNYPKNGSTFFWGNYLAVYNALKPYNGLRSTCTFNISVRPYPCPSLNVSINGALVCNGWMDEYTSLCIVFCKTGTKLYHRNFRTKYTCGASGIWYPTKTIPDCVNRRGRTRPSKEDRPYFFQRCSDGEKSRMREKYLDVLKESNFKELCNKYPDLCKKENVDVRC